MVEKFADIKFKESTLLLVAAAVSIINEYQQDGYSLTLRQLYYQFVARDLIENTTRSYKRLGSIINDARLAGLIDWDAIEDRTRNLESPPAWDNPGEIVDAAIRSYKLDHWLHQRFRPEVWVEKEALAGVVEKPCKELDMAFFCCRGYVSQSEMYSAAKRLRASWRIQRQAPVILHLGDHDPSGIDMTRDIIDRVEMFAGFKIEIRRIALNMLQIEELKPPPNPAKVTDSRYRSYQDRYGESSWELDALSPAYIYNLIKSVALTYRDEEIYNETITRQEEQRNNLKKLKEELL